MFIITSYYTPDYYPLVEKTWEENKVNFFPELPILSSDFTTDYSQISIKKLLKILVTKIYKNIVNS